MTLSNMRGLHDPVRSEREARLEAENKRLRERAAFLLDRLRDFGNGIEDERVFTQWNGHVAPAISRLSAALSATASRGGDDERVSI